MKKLLLILIIASMAIPVSAQFTKGMLQATGLTCAMCSNAINKALQKVSFVASVQSDIKNSSFNIIFKTDAPVRIDAIKEAVEDAGFSIGSLQLTGSFQEKKIEKDEHLKIGNENFHFLNGSNQEFSGVQTMTVVDKNFVTEKQFKKFSASAKMSCMKTGKAESCCVKEGIMTNERVYHVTI